MKIYPMAEEFFCAGGRTDKQADDMIKLIVLLSNFVHAPKIQTKQNTLDVTKFSLHPTLLKIKQ
jgi:hypothetical protein